MGNLVAHIEGGKRLRAFDNGLLRRIFVPKIYVVKGGGENYIMRNLIICTVNTIFFG